ncbi:MAG TPA: hypothetical protein VGN22_12410, partial [Pseudonocardia sp.]
MEDAGSAGEAPPTTTLLIAVATPTGRGTTEVVVIWVGDSRAYVVRDGGVAGQVTDDHTWSVLEEDTAAPVTATGQVVTRWLGTDPSAQPDVVAAEVTGPGALILTTNGLHDHFPTPDALAATASPVTAPGRGADALVDAVRAAGGTDDATAAVVALNRGGTGPGTPAPRQDGGRRIGGVAPAAGAAVLLGLAAVADLVVGHHGGFAMAAAGVPFWRLLGRRAGGREPVLVGALRAPGVQPHRLGTMTRVARVRGNDRVVLAELPEGMRWVKRGRTPAHPIASAASAMQFRVLGGPAPLSHLAIAREAQELGDVFTVGRHEVVEVAHSVPGQSIVRWEDLPPALRDAVLDELAAVTFVPNAMSGNWDGPMPWNVIIGTAVTQIDFERSERFLPGRVADIESYSDPGMPAIGRGDGSLAAFLRLLLHIHPDVYGRLSESEVVTQLAEMLRHRDRLFATALDERVLHRTLRDLEWAEQVVTAGRLSAAPGGAEIEESRALAQELVLHREGLGDPRRRARHAAEAAARAAAVDVVPGPRGGHIENLTPADLAALSDAGQVQGVHGYDAASSTWTATVVRQQPRVPASSTADEEWVAMLASARRYPNLLPAGLEHEIRRAAQLGVKPAQVGTAAATEVMAENAVVNWALRTDGTLWVSPRFGPVGEHMEWIKHTVLTSGEPVLAAGEAIVGAEGDSIAGTEIFPTSGHYHDNNSPEDNRKVLALGRVAFARHGITFPGDDGHGRAHDADAPAPVDELLDARSQAGTERNETSGARGPAAGQAERDLLALLHGQVRIRGVRSQEARVGPYAIEVDGVRVAIYKTLPAGLSREWEDGEPVREIGAYRLAEELGWDDLVPPTTEWHGPHGPGSVQEWVHGTQPGAWEIAEYESFDRERTAVLDYVMGNTDRNPGNYLGHLGRLRLIDHGLAFPRRAELVRHTEDVVIDSEFVVEQQGESLSEGVLADVRALDPVRLGERLRTTGLGDYEVVSALARLREI